MMVCMSVKHVGHYGKLFIIPLLQTQKKKNVRNRLRLVQNINHRMCELGSNPGSRVPNLFFLVFR